MIEQLINNYSIKEWEGSGRGSGQVRLFGGNRESGRVNVSSGRVQEKWPVNNSRPIHVLTELNVAYLWFLGEIIITQLRHMASPCADEQENGFDEISVGKATCAPWDH